MILSRVPNKSDFKKSFLVLTLLKCIFHCLKIPYSLKMAQVNYLTQRQTE